jgi:hypothetical protein
MGMMRNKASTRSVIYSSYLMNGTPCPCSAQVAQWLRGRSDRVQDSTTAGCGSSSSQDASTPIRRLVVGHQPHGDAPLTMNVFGLQVRFMLWCARHMAVL